MRVLINDDLNKRSAKHANKTTLVARGAGTQLRYGCVSAPIATNVDLWNPICGLHINTHMSEQSVMHFDNY